MTHETVITDMDLQAFFDGELPYKDELQVSTALVSSPKLRERFKRLENQRDLLNQWYNHIAETYH